MTNSPYPGLRPFYRDEADIFFGRENQVDQLLEKLDHSRFLSIIGPSGCGKSSLVRAGMINALETGFLVNAGPSWKIIEMRPGSHPLLNLAEALMNELPSEPGKYRLEHEKNYCYSILKRGPLGLLEALHLGLIELNHKTNFLLIVDQFEEIFRYHKEVNSDEAEAFVDLLLATKSQREAPLYVVITMRSDFIGDCALFSGLPETINECQFLIPRLSRNQLRAAIEGPARVWGCKIETALTNRLLNDMGLNQDQLPLMQHLLMRIWSIKTKNGIDETEYPESDFLNNRKEIILTLDDYKSVGGLEKALSNHADNLYNQLNEKQKKIAETLFRCLSERSFDKRDTRRPEKLEIIASVANVSPDELVTVVEVFRQQDCSFITPPINTNLYNDTVLDISHESLIRQWDKMNQWVENESRSAETYHRLEQTACLWKINQAALWSTPDLENALAWKENEQPTEIWAKRYGINFQLAMEFLEASALERKEQEKLKETAHQHELEQALALAEEQKRRTAIESQRLEEQTRANKRLRRLSIALGIVSIIAFLFAISLVIQREIAKQQYKLARSRELNYMANGFLNIDPENSVKLALEAASITYSSKKSTPNEVNETLHRAVQASRVRMKIKENAYRFAYSPDSKKIATACFDNTSKIWDTNSGKKLLTLLGHRQTVYGVEFNNNGTKIGTASDDFTGKIWDAESGQLILTLNGHEGGVLDIDFDPNERFIATASRDWTAKIWDIKTGNEIHTLIGHLGWIYSIEFSPDGLLIATASRDGTAKLWEVSSGKEVFTYRGHQNEVLDVTFSPDGKKLATASRDHRAKIWDINTGNLLFTYSGHLNGVWGVNFSPDGDYLLTASLDGTIKEWSVNSGQLIYTLIGHNCQVLKVAFSPDAKRIASCDSDGNIRFWTTITGEEIDPLIGHWGEIYSVAFCSDNKLIASGGSDSNIKVWNRQSGEEIFSFQCSGIVNCVSFSPDGLRLAGSDGNGTIKIWDMETGQELLDTIVHYGSIFSISFSPDGFKIAASGESGMAKIIDSSTGKELINLSVDDYNIEDIAFSPNGHFIATCSENGEVRLWDAISGEKIITFDYGSHVRAISFSKDNEKLAAAGLDRKTKIWDVSTGKELLNLFGHTDTIRDIVYSPDGKYFFSAGWDGRINMWDAIKGNEILNLTHYPNQIYDIDVSPDSKCIASVGTDNIIRLYFTNIEDLMELAKKRIINPS